MKTVHEYTYEILRQNNINIIFGNPGSNELPFLKNFPADFKYILALHEGAAVAMADGYAQALGRVAFVNLHSAAGTGNAMGALSNAWNSHSPLLITSGQQTRQMMGVEALLTNFDATLLPRPLVKWSHEPASAAEVPHAISRAIAIANAEASGPVYLSIPYNDWDVEVDDENQHLLKKQVKTAQCLSKQAISDVHEYMNKAKNIAVIFGPDIDRQNAFDDAVKFAEKLNAPVWGAPSPPRCPFPNQHPQFQGFLPASIAGIAAILAAFDLVLVFGAPIFRYHQYEPGEYLAPNTTLIAFSCDIQEAARAPMGLIYVCDLKNSLKRLTQNLLPKRKKCQPRPSLLAAAPSTGEYIAPERLFDLINTFAPKNSIYTNESTSTNHILWERVHLNKQGRYYFAAAGGLGYAMPAAIGIQLAKPKSQVISIIGDGSANYSITALWTAAQYKLPIIFIILRNGNYAALRWFSEVLGVQNVPGIDIPNIDFTQLAQGYGVNAYRVNNDEAFVQSFKLALDAQAPTLIEVQTVA